MHEWQNTFVSAHGGGRRGRRHPPIWRCPKCGTKVEDWQKPPDDLKIETGTNRKPVSVTCEEYVAYQVMES